MTPNLLLIVACISLLLSATMSIGSRLLVDFSRRELDLYCRRHLLGARFAEIMSAHDRVAMSVSSLKTIMVVSTLVCGTLWLLGLASELSVARLASAVVVLGFIMLLMLDWIPVGMVKLWSAPLLSRSWPLWKGVEFLMAPIVVPVHLIERFFRRAAGRGEETEEEEEEAFEDEIRAIVTSGMREGWMEEDAREMIEGVMDLGDDNAGNIMTPRGEVDALSCDTDWPRMLQFLTQVKRTRVPVYQGSMDNVVGVLYVKDLLPHFSDDAAVRPPVAEITRTPWFVPDSIPVDELLQEFLRTRKHLAVVVDEYGAVAGVVTIEDVLEEIVGEILDESDQPNAPEEFRSVDNHVTDVAGRTQIEDVNDRLGIAIPESDVYDTIGGFVIARLGYIPEPGEKIEENGYELSVREADRRRVLTVRVTRQTNQRESA